MSEKSKDSEIEKEPRQINFPSIMSIKEAACYLTISTYFLYGLVKAGCVPYAKINIINLSPLFKNFKIK